ncbi:MAG: Crp/Fnr family transcriptional regulator [Bacteroidota bacterium]|nr:Crp/Fnr family transcriptional regulator [Bacteroidota bacterium]
MKGTFPECQNCTCRKDSLFNNCAIDEMETLTANKSCNVYKKGQTIFHEGNRPHGVYCISEGKVKISRLGSDGKEQIVRLAKQGDTLGYRSLIEGSKYTASAVALDDSKVCFISSDDFNKIVDNNAKVANDLLKLIARALGEAEDKLTNLALKPVRERLAEALLLLQRTYQTENEKEPFSISISREDLAAIVGTAKETVIRSLSDLKDDGIVSAQGSTITILKPEQLLKISHLYD